jgi:hypothetical protein
MRLFYLSLISIAVVLGASAFGTSVAGAGQVAVRPPANNAAIFADAVLAPNGVRRKPRLEGSVDGLDPAFDPPHPRENAFRLAQSSTSVATSGNPVVAPFKWTGLLTIPAPTKRYPNETVLCTAQFIKPNVLLTAGHCIKDLASNPTGPWPDPTKGTFLLQYQNRVGTSFSILCAATNPLWTLPSNFNSLTSAQQDAAQNAIMLHDFAMILVNGTSQTGAMPYALDWKGKYNFADRIGYPADILGDQIIQDAPGVVFFANAIPIGDLASPNLVIQWGPVTDATQGMSGGAWVANSSVNEGPGKNVLIAVTSFGPTVGSSSQPLYPGGTFASYLTAAEFNPLLAFVSNGCK